MEQEIIQNSLLNDIILKVENIKSELMNGNYTSIKENDIAELYNSISKVENEALKESFNKNADIISTCLFSSREELANVETRKERLNKAIDSLDEITFAANRLGFVDVQNRQAQRNKDSLDSRARQYEHDYLRDEAYYFLQTIKRHDGSRAYTDESLNNSATSELIDTADRIKEFMTKEELDKHLKEAEENKRNTRETANDISGETNNNSDETSENNIDDSSNNAMDSNTDDKTIDEGEIDKFKEDLEEKDIEDIKENVEKLKETANKSNILTVIERLKLSVLKIYELEQKEFEDKLTVSDNFHIIMATITERNSEILNYESYLIFEDIELNDIAKEAREELKNQINEMYNESKENGIYCFKNFEEVSNSWSYVLDTIDKDPLEKATFDNLVQDVITVIDNGFVGYDEWREKYSEFIQKYDNEKALPYINAMISIKHPGIELNPDLTINKKETEGIEVQPEGPENGEKNKDGENKPEPTEIIPTEPYDEGLQPKDPDGISADPEDPEKGNKKDPNKKPIKKRCKVKKVLKNIKDWYMKHPVRNSLVLGLALSVGLPTVLPGLMMVNSTLWSILGGKGALCATLHSINLGLSKVAGFGAFKFVEATGLYTMGGSAAASALPLYTSVGAKLTTAALALGGIGASVANKINKGKKKDPEKDPKEPEKDPDDKIIDDTKTPKDPSVMPDFTEEQQKWISSLLQQQAMQTQTLYNMLKKMGLSDEEIKTKYESEIKEASTPEEPGKTK